MVRTLLLKTVNNNVRLVLGESGFPVRGSTRAGFSSTAMCSSVERIACWVRAGAEVRLRKDCWRSWEMSQVSRTSVESPSAGLSSYRQMRPPTRPIAVVLQAIRRSGSNSMTVLVVRYGKNSVSRRPRIAMTNVDPSERRVDRRGAVEAGMRAGIAEQGENRAR